MAGKLSSALSSFTDDQQTWTWTVFRVLTAAMYITHGYTKLFGENPQPPSGGMSTLRIADLVSYPVPFDINLLFIAGLIEVVGGGLIVLGLFTRFTALICALNMLMAYLIAHIAWFPTLNRGELAAMYFVAFLVIFAYGAGPVSLDTWRDMQREKKQQKKMEKLMG